MRRALIAIVASLAILSPASGQSQRAAKVGRSPGFSAGLRFLGGAASSGPITTIADSFTATNGTVLTSRAADTGGTWQKSTGQFTITSNRIYVSTAAAWYSNSLPPSSADEFAQADLYFASTGLGQAAYVALRAASQASTANQYFFGWRSSTSQLELLKLIGGTNTTLATAPLTPVAGSSYTIRLEVQGSSLRGYLNGSLVASATDSSITAPGYIAINAPGVVASTTTGTHFDNFSAGTL